MKNKGFTLIELLAVIVILAIIALIAVPIVLNIIKDSKESATLRSAELYMDAVNMAIARNSMTTAFPSGETECGINSDGNLLCSEVGSDPIPVDINGDVPTGGQIKFSNEKIVKDSNTYLIMSDGKKYSYTDGKLGVQPEVTYAGERTTLNTHAQSLPSDATSNTNLANELTFENVYYNGSTWGSGTQSITIPVVAGDRITSVSFGPKTTNGSGIHNKDGIRVTYFSDNTVVSSVTPDDVYSEFSTNGYLTVPSGANAVCIPIWTVVTVTQDIKLLTLKS